MIAVAEGIPPTRDARAHGDCHQSNEPEALHGADGDRARLVTKRIGADSAGLIVNEPSFGSIRGVGDRIRGTPVRMGIPDRLLQ